MVSFGWMWLSEISDITSRSEVSEGSEVPESSDHSRTVNAHEVFRNCKFMCTQTLFPDRHILRRRSPSARLDGSKLELAENIPDIAPRHGLVVFDSRANILSPRRPRNLFSVISVSICCLGLVFVCLHAFSRKLASWKQQREYLV